MSAFLPQFQHDVFISYARVDNQPLLPGDEGSCWVLALEVRAADAVESKGQRREALDGLGADCRQRAVPR